MTTKNIDTPVPSFDELKKLGYDELISLLESGSLEHLTPPERIELEWGGFTYWEGVPVKVER